MNKDKPAFPWCGDLNECPTINLGMTLRDYFAAKAMQGFLACSNEEFEDQKLRNENYKEYCTMYAESAYQMADAMLKAREE